MNCLQVKNPMHGLHSSVNGDYVLGGQELAAMSVKRWGRRSRHTGQTTVEYENAEKALSNFLKSLTRIQLKPKRHLNRLGTSTRCSYVGYYFIVLSLKYVSKP
jgi:hypothetical protein